MSGHIDNVFESEVGIRSYDEDGEYVDGIWVPGTTITTQHRITVQPLNSRELDALDIGAERVVDTRKIYLNDGTVHRLNDRWTLESGAVYIVISVDCRPTRNYCKIVAVLSDPDLT